MCNPTELGIEPADSSEQMFVHFSDIVGRGYKRLDPGEMVEYVIGLSDRGRGQKAYRVTRLEVGPALERFAVIRDMNAHLDALANLAQKENWEYRHSTSSHPLPVLYNYIYYTFDRLQDEGKIAETTNSTR